MSGILYLVSTHIGNPGDLTLRGRRILSQVDAVVCEEQRVGSTFLSHYDITKPLVELNEHTEATQAPVLVEQLALGQNIALISDHGTPLLADPGAMLVKMALAAGIQIVPIPGASAILAALVVSGLPATRFRFLGQLPQKTEPRQRALAGLKNLPETLVLLEAPYRLMKLLRSLQDAFSPERRVAVACNLTMSDERIVRGPLGEVIHEFEERPFKGEFVLVVEGAKDPIDNKGVDLKAIILLAGLGTRLRPHTYSRPKPLVNVAGKPVLAHILDGMANLNFEEIIFVVGYLGDQIQAYVTKSYPKLRACYVEQTEMRGQAHAIVLAKHEIDQEVLIIFGDTIWETDWARLGRVTGDGLIFTKEVSDPRRFGVVIIEDGYVKRFVEKPDKPISYLAVVGVYYVKDWRGLVGALDDVMAQNIQTQGEYYLADALQLMVSRGARFEAETIPVWEDCGTREALLQTNRYLLGKNGTHHPPSNESQIIQPVYIAEDAQIVRSIIGPYVSISSGAVIEDSILRDCIISEDAHITNATLELSLVGKDARVRGTFERLNVGDSSEIDFSK